jgi:hypothetical protein
MTDERFHEHRPSVFIPDILQLRTNPVFADELGVLLMDSVSAHVSERNLKLLGGNKIIALVFPAHTTNPLQALDLVFFGAIKKNKDSLAGEPRHRLNGRADMAACSGFCADGNIVHDLIILPKIVGVGTVDSLLAIGAIGALDVTSAVHAFDPAGR